jgi:hypothetical protein
VVREHYPAFSLAEQGTFRVDQYQGFHPDIFLHADGHSYIGNNVTASVIAAIPLFIFDPVLDLLEKYEKRKIQREGVPKTVYRTKHTNSKIFLETVKERGLSLRFGGATVVTSVFLMAPLSALIVVFMFQILCLRGLSEKQAFWLSLFFGFGTPVFFRTGVLNHNMFLMYAGFATFYLLWVRSGTEFPVSLNRRLLAGFLSGFGLALDYSGVIPLVVFYGYLVISRLPTASLRISIKESFPFILGSIPPVLFLLYSQWAMFGNLFMPGQYWMPDETFYPVYYKNPYSNMGFRGFTLPALDLYYLSLFALSYGMYTYGPILALGLIPTYFYKRESLILPRRERIFVAIYFVLFLTFCAANQYSRIQFNSGFRYLVPLVPLIYLQVCDHLVRIPRRWLIVLLTPVLIHSWVISMVRESVPESWQRVLTEGIQLPWLHVLKSTSAEGHPILSSQLLPLIIILFVFLLVFFVWKIGNNKELQLRTSKTAGNL